MATRRLCVRAESDSRELIVRNMSSVETATFYPFTKFHSSKFRKRLAGERMNDAIALSSRSS